MSSFLGEVKVLADVCMQAGYIYGSPSNYFVLLCIRIFSVCSCVVKLFSILCPSTTYFWEVNSATVLRALLRNNLMMQSLQSLVDKSHCVAIHQSLKIPGALHSPNGIPKLHHDTFLW